MRSLDAQRQVRRIGEVMAFAKAKKREPVGEDALFDYAVGVLARKMRTVRDLKRLMRNRAEEGDAGERAMDAVLCASERAWISQRHSGLRRTTRGCARRTRSSGGRRVQQDLMQKGVHKELIATTLAKAYDEVDEAALAREYVARKRMKKPSGENAQKETARVMGRLVRAGFSSGAIYKVLREWDLPEEAMPVEGGADSDSVRGARRGAAGVLDGANGSRRQGEESGDEIEGSAYDDAHQAEGQQDEPDERVEDERGEGDRPADNEQDAEEQEFEHAGLRT